MFQVFYIIWYFLIIFPFLIFLEGTTMFSKFLKKKNIYSHWDYWHSWIVVLVILVVILWLMGYR